MDNKKNENALIRYFCCEDKIIVRIVAEESDNIDILEYYNPRYEGWIPSREWYNDMFVNKVVNYKEITKEEALNYIKSSVEYFKRMIVNPVYLRRIYGLNLEYFNDKTSEWQKVNNASWYEKLDEYQRVSKEEVDKYVKRKVR